MFSARRKGKRKSEPRRKPNAKPLQRKDARGFLFCESEHKEQCVANNEAVQQIVIRHANLDMLYCNSLLRRVGLPLELSPRVLDVLLNRPKLSLFSKISSVFQNIMTHQDYFFSMNDTAGILYSTRRLQREMNVLFVIRADLGVAYRSTRRCIDGGDRGMFIRKMQSINGRVQRYRQFRKLSYYCGLMNDIIRFSRLSVVDKDKKSQLRAHPIVACSDYLLLQVMKFVVAGEVSAVSVWDKNVSLRAGIFYCNSVLYTRFLLQQKSLGINKMAWQDRKMCEEDNADAASFKVLS